MSANTVIRTNMHAINTHRQSGQISRNQALSMSRLSSGHRINNAADDAAGLGISEKMRAQIRSLDRASHNAQDGISLIQTAEGALSTISDILTRIRELTIQASNDTSVGGTGSASDRLRIQDEIDQLMEEIDSIAKRTEFNTRGLLNGSLYRDGVIRGGEWLSVEKVRINAPAQIQALDQFLRMTDRGPLIGSFADLLSAIGANLQGLSAEEWIAAHAGTNFSGLAQALDAAMGVEFSALGTPLAGTGRWDETGLVSGMHFANADDLLNLFVQGLHNPNALRTDTTAGTAQQNFANWSDFIQNANPDMGASTFARAMSQTGGEALYQALIRAGYRGLTENSTFNDVRNIFYTLGGGWSTGTTGFELRDALLTLSPGHNSSWLENRVGGVERHVTHVSEITDLTGNGIEQTILHDVIINGEPHTGMMYTLVGSVAASPTGVATQITNVARINTRDGRVQIQVRSYDPPSGPGTSWWPDINIWLERPDGQSDLMFGYQGNHLNIPGPGNFAVGDGNIFYTGWQGFPEYFIVDNLPEGYYVRIGIRNGGSPQSHNFVVDIIGLIQQETIIVTDPWEIFRDRYLRAEAEITQRDVWNPSEAKRERGNALWFQIGANSSQGINVEIGSMSTGTLFGREGANHTQERRIVNVLDVFGYNVQDGISGGSNYGPVIGGSRVGTLLEAIDEAHTRASRLRSSLGATQNRLEHTIENLDIASENLNASNSRIRDADMASEMMTLTRANVLQQAVFSTLTQANQSSQAVLQLLG